MSRDVFNTFADVVSSRLSGRPLAYNADFYRYTEKAVGEVFFEGYSEVTDEIIVRRTPNPFMVAAGKK
jgi:hypothetical protein